MAKVKTTTIHIYDGDDVVGICGEPRTVPEEGFLKLCSECHDIYKKQEDRRSDAPTS